MSEVAENKVVTLAFSIKDKTGKVLDEAPADEPLSYLHGAGGLPEGIEKAITGMKVGEQKDVELPAKDAFGERDESRVEKVARHRLGKNLKPKKGDILRIETESGVTDATIINVTPVTVTLDLNHPLAGRDLSCHFHVMSMRDATKDEIAHGHAHGADGHAGHDHSHAHSHDHDEDCGHDHNHPAGEDCGHDHDHGHSHSHDHK